MEEKKFNLKQRSSVEQIDLVNSINTNPNLPDELKDDLIVLIEIYKRNGLSDSYIKGVLADITKKVFDDYLEDKRFNTLIGRKAVNEIQMKVQKIIKQEGNESEKKKQIAQNKAKLDAILKKPN